ncbi:OmpA family protein [Trichloromonas sp.]|uniref:OmpA family protein n=1 Tax=Trichloromonas sp. TaxID=3069249 RepID=UPI003D817A47
MKKLSGYLTLLVLLSGLSACVPAATHTHRGSHQGSRIGAGDRIGYVMDRQEQDLRQALAGTRAASVQRDQNLLVATFRSKLLFGRKSVTLKPGSNDELDRVAQVLNRYPGTHIRIEGHTNAKGPERDNLRLSARQAQTFKQALVQRGVAPHRIFAIGYGESRMIASNHAANARVVVVIEPRRQAYGFADQY